MFKPIDTMSPSGSACYPFLNIPDTKFDENGVYRVQLRVSEKEGKEFVKVIKAYHKDTYAYYLEESGKKTLKKCDLPIKKVEDDQGNPTGELEFNFKLKARGMRKDGTEYENSVRLFDAKGTPVVGGDSVGSGSHIKIATLLRGWYVPAIGVGVTLGIKAVQIIDLVPYTPGQNSATDFGFGEEEGFVAPPQEEAQPEQTVEVAATTDSSKEEGEWGDF